MRISILILFILQQNTINANGLEGLYVNRASNNNSEIVLNLNSDSTYSYFLMNEFGYGTTLVNRCGRYSIKADTLILKTIILYDTIKIGDTAIVFNNKFLNFQDYLSIEPMVFNSNSEVCIEIDKLLKSYFPDLRIYKNFDFKNELQFDKNKQVRFDHSKNSVFNYLNFRSSYFKIDMNFESYYKLNQNFLKIIPKANLMKFKRQDFSPFAKYLIKGNRLEFIDAIESDKYNLLSNPFTLTLQKAK